MKTKIISLIVCILAFSTAFSQDYDYERKFSIGAFSDLGFNYHHAQFTSVPENPACCPAFDNGMGLGLSPGLFFEFPVNDYVHLQLRTSLSANGVDLSKRDNFMVSVNGTPTQGVSEHRLDVDLWYLKINPLFSFNLFDKMHLLIGGGYSYLLRDKYTQEEMLISPPKATFENGSRSKNYYDYESIPNKNNHILSFDGGLSYHIPLTIDGSVIFAPEIMFSYRLTHLVRNSDWYFHTAGIGFSIIFSITEHNEILEY